MGQINEFEPCTLTNEQFVSVKIKLTTVCDRMCDAQVLDLADALHDIIRTRQRIRCQSRLAGASRLGEEARTF